MECQMNKPVLAVPFDDDNSENRAFPREVWLLMLGLGLLPARLSIRQAALILGFTPANLFLLIKEGELVPLGCPGAYRTRMFFREDILQRASDKKWLAKATRLIQSSSDED